MTKPGNERREVNRSAQQLCATELDGVVGGTGKTVKTNNDTHKSISQNNR